MTVPRLGHTHVRVTTIEAKGKAEAWLKMQGENWSAHGEARPLIEHLELTHTSMSVGDVLRDEEGEYWECLDTSTTLSAGLGWRRVEGDSEGEGHVLHEKAPE